jgi:hypothetical protein
MQIDNPTPTGLVRIVLIFTALSSFFKTFMNANDIFNDHTEHTVALVLDFFNGVIVTVLPFFGVQVTAKRVPIEDVTAMKDTGKIIIWIILCASFFYSL